MLRHLILGLLRGGPALHGYALMKEYRQQCGIEISIGNLYRELQHLAADGLVRPTANPPGADPRRVPYEITPAGVTAFHKWLSTPTTSPVTECGTAFASRALFLGQEDPALGRKLIAQWRDDLSGRRNALERRSESERVSPPAKALLSRRLRHIAADLDFVAELNSAYEGWAARRQPASGTEGVGGAAQRRPKPRTESDSACRVSPGRRRS